MLQPLKVLYVHQYFNSPKDSGGTRSYELATRMAKAGMDVHMITSDRQGTGSRWTTHAVDGVTVHRFPVPYRSEMGYSRRIGAFARFAWSATRRALSLRGDVVYASSTPLTVAIPAIACRVLQRTPYVFEVRDLWPEIPIALRAISNPALKLLARMLERIAYAGAAHVIALSPGMAEGVRRSGGKGTPVTVASNACDAWLAHAPPGEVQNFRRQRFPDLLDRPAAVYAGTFGMLNGVGYLVEIALELRRRGSTVALIAVGGGAEFDIVRAAAAREGVLDRNLFVVPRIPKQEIPLLLGMADACMSLFIDEPAMWNNSANKFFDALAAGRPVIVNYGGWQCELVERTGAGLRIPARDAKAAAGLLDRFLADRPALIRAGTAALELGKREFDRDRLCTKVINIVRDVTDGTH